MRIQKKSSPSEAVEVSMSPLIDCVFLLLIFFLVTTMIKKTEQRIPLQSVSNVTSLSSKIVTQKNYIGILKRDVFLRPIGQLDEYGRAVYQKITDLKQYLDTLASRGGKNKDLVLRVQKDVEFQDVLAVVDSCVLRGFKKIKTQLESDNFRSKW